MKKSTSVTADYDFNLVEFCTRFFTMLFIRICTATNLFILNNQYHFIQRSSSATNLVSVCQYPPLKLTLFTDLGRTFDLFNHGFLLNKPNFLDLIHFCYNK